MAKVEMLIKGFTSADQKANGENQDKTMIEETVGLVSGYTIHT